MSAFARQIANEEPGGIIDGKDNVFNKTYRGGSARRHTHGKVHGFANSDLCHCATLGLVATGQGAAHHPAVTV